MGNKISRLWSLKNAQFNVHSIKWIKMTHLWCILVPFGVYFTVSGSPCFQCSKTSCYEKPLWGWGKCCNDCTPSGGVNLTSDPSSVSCADFPKLWNKLQKAQEYTRGESFLIHFIEWTLNWVFFRLHNRLYFISHTKSYNSLKFSTAVCSDASLGCLWWNV